MADRLQAAQQLRVWHIPQVPMQPFYVPVQSVQEAVLVLKTLWRYDAFQYENHVKPDYCNAGGLEVYEDGKWCEWCNEDGQEIDDIMEEQN